MKALATGKKVIKVQIGIELIFAQTNL